MALLSTLTDDFSGASLDTTRWQNDSSGGGTLTVAGGTLTETTSAGNNNSAAVLSSKFGNTYTFTGSSLTVRAAASTTASVVTYIMVFNAAGTGQAFFALNFGGMRGYVKGTAGTWLYNGVTIGTYTNAQTYYRVRVDGASRVYFETSPDNITWTTTDTGVSIDWGASVRAQVYTQNAGAAVTGTTVVDAVNPTALTEPSGIADPETFTGPTAIKSPYLTALTDGFNGATLDATKWAYNQANSSTVTVSGGAAHFTLPSTASGTFATMYSTGTYTMLGSSIYAKVAPPPATTGLVTYLRLVDSTLTARRVEIYLADGVLYGRVLNQSSAVVGNVANLGAYNPATMAYWRIAVNGAGSVFYGVSADGTNWTETVGSTASLWGERAQVQFAVWHTTTVATAPSVVDLHAINVIEQTVTPNSLNDPETIVDPAAGYLMPVAPEPISDGEYLGQPTVSTGKLPAAYGVGVYGAGLYGQGQDDEVVQVPDTPTGQTNYQYGAGVYSEGPYYGAVVDSGPTDNPTYGSGTYGHGIYYGLFEPVKEALPLFNDYAGVGRNPLHIIGIGPWSPVIRWRGAANYGVGAGNLPARPALPMPPASSKGFTLRLDEGCEARFELNLARGAGLIIDEMDTDVWWRRKDPRTGTVEMIGRFNVSHANHQTSDTGLNVSVQCEDYTSLLGQRLITRYLHPSWPDNQTQWDEGTPITDIIRWAVPTNLRLDLSELDTYDLGAVTVTAYDLPPGTSIAEMMEQLSSISPIAWEWWVETPNDINASPKLRFQLGTRGLDKGVVLHDLGKGPTPIASWSRNTAADNYANTLLYNGADGSVVYKIDAQVLQYGQRDAVAGNSTIDGTQIQLMRARARKKLERLASREATYTIRLAAGFWRGRSHIDVGDTITLVLRLGKETLREKHRVTEITVDIDAQGSEDVTVTLGTPPASADPRSKRSPLQRIVRHLREYKTPGGKERVITPDDE